MVSIDCTEDHRTRNLEISLVEALERWSVVSVLRTKMSWDKILKCYRLQLTLLIWLDFLSGESVESVGLRHERDRLGV